MLRDERISPDVVQAQGQALQKLRLGYRELFDDIDRLSSQRSASVLERPSISKVDEQRKDKELDDLLVYARKFIREARTVVPVQHDNQAVQCDAAEKCNKVVATPADWIERPEDTGKLSPKEESVAERTTAIQIVQILPKGVTEREPVEPPLNNQKLAVTKEVRNIGTNVNFVAPRAIKRTNHLHGYVIPPPSSRRCAATSKPQSAPSQRSLFVQPLTKVRGASATGELVARGSIKAANPPRRTFTNAQFKKLFDQYLAMKGSKDEPAGKPIGEENGSGDHGEGGDPTTLAPLASVAAPDLEAGGQTKEQSEIVKEAAQAPEDGEEKMAESLKFSSHMLPSVSIKGRWDANLQVRQTSNIAIIENGTDGCYASTNEQNVKYVEMKHGLERTSQSKDAVQVQIPSISEAVKETPMTTRPTYQANAPIDQAIRMESNKANEEPSSAPTESGHSEAIEKGVTVVRVPKSAYKTAASRKCATRKPNRYLEPFTRLTGEKQSPKPSVDVMLELFDDDSTSSTDDEADYDADTVRSLLNLNSEHDDGSSTDTEPPAAAKLALKTPQCQRSLLEVFSIPTLRSPSGEVPLESSESPDTVDYSTPGRSGSKFLENLRIWKSAVEVQSQNMQLGHKLTENLDALKENIQAIKEQTAGMANLAHSYRMREEELLAGEQSTGATAHSERTMNASPVQPSKSCECFGCQSTFEGPSVRPATSPPFDTKRFQRVVLERSPRYAKTIAKICALGSKGQWENAKQTSNPIGGGPREVDLARTAARKFLQSWQGTRSREGSSCSSTRSAPLRSNDSHVSSKLYSEDLMNGFEKWQSGQMSEGVESQGGSDDRGTVESGWCEIQSVAESDSSIALDIDCASESGESSSVPLIFRPGSTTTISDEGEVLSHGEIKFI